MFRHFSNYPPPDNDGLLGQNVLDNCILNFRNKTLTLLEAPIKKEYRIANRLISSTPTLTSINLEKDTREPEIIIDHFPKLNAKIKCT